MGVVRAPSSRAVGAQFHPQFLRKPTFCPCGVLDADRDVIDHLLLLEGQERI